MSCESALPEIISRFRDLPVAQAQLNFSTPMGQFLNLANLVFLQLLLTYFTLVK